MSNISILGQNIKRLRNEREMSAYRVSKIAGVSQSTISEIENGIRQTLNAVTVEKIAKALDVTQDQLMSIESEKDYVMTSDFQEAINVLLDADALEIDGIVINDMEKKTLIEMIPALCDEIRRIRNERC